MLIKLKKRDGSEIFVYTVLKPIYDLSTKCRYVIRFHTELEHVSPYDIKVMEDLCQLVPSTLYIDAIDEDLTDLNVRQGKNSQSKISTEIE